MELPDEILLELNGLSKHGKGRKRTLDDLNRDSFNENNSGMGLLARWLDEDIITEFGLGQYRNSLGDPSNYIQFNKKKRLLSGDLGHIDAGLSAGLITGYPGIDVMPALLPLLSVGTKNFDMNLRYTPNIEGITPETFMLNADYKLFGD